MSSSIEVSSIEVYNMYYIYFDRIVFLINLKKSNILLQQLNISMSHKIGKL